MRHISTHTTPWVRLEADLLGQRRVVAEPPPIMPVSPKPPEEVASVQAKLAAFLEEVGGVRQEARPAVAPRPLPDAQLLERYEAILGAERLAVEAWGAYRVARRAWDEAGSVGPKPKPPTFPTPSDSAQAAYLRITALRARLGEVEA